MRVRGTAAAIGAAVLVTAMAMPGTSAPSGPKLVLGKPLFWDGGYVASAVTSNLPVDLACKAAPCSSFPLTLPKGGTRLRVALDTPFRGDEFQLDLIDPKGVVAASTTGGGTEFDIEAFVDKPVAGAWTVHVIPRDVDHAAFRLRAKLEGAAKTYAKKTALLPDLMVTPPYEFGFVAPANPANGLYPPDTVNPPLDVLGEHPLSCTADEIADTHPTRCLRFTTGPRNMGPGPFEIDYDPTEALVAASGYTPASLAAGLLPPGPAVQRVYNSDGTSTTRPAGQFQFHTTHGHYHYLDILTFQLFAIGPKHELSLIGTGKKLGFCPADELFADWATFNQQSSKTFTANCGYSTGTASLGLNVGWGDVYRWQRPGQFVDMGTHGDGFYVLRVTVNPKGNVAEVTRSNDSGYAYIHVVKDSVGLVERGQGLSPWDKHKRVFTDQN